MYVYGYTYKKKGEYASVIILILFQKVLKLCETELKQDDLI